MIAASHSQSELLGELLFGSLAKGAVYSRRDVRFGDYVVSLTQPGAPRMPNGIECRVRVRLRDKVVIGGGRLVIGATAVEAGPAWDPVPSKVNRAGVLRPGAEPLLHVVAPRANSNAAAEDDVLAGYVAGLVLLHDQRDRATRLALAAIARTDALHATLLRHAARGEVPEPVHALLAGGDTGPLLAFGGGSGQSWLRGLLSAGFPLAIDVIHRRAAVGVS